jgi:hypothetical protein
MFFLAFVPLQLMGAEPMARDAYTHQLLVGRRRLDDQAPPKSALPSPAVDRGPHASMHLLVL